VRQRARLIVETGRSSVNAFFSTTDYNAFTHTTEVEMPKKQKRSEGLTFKRPERIKLSAKESLKRMEEFPK
jgi:hypothetical protein